MFKMLTCFQVTKQAVIAIAKNAMKCFLQNILSSVIFKMQKLLLVKQKKFTATYVSTLCTIF